MTEELTPELKAKQDMVWQRISDLQEKMMKNDPLLAGHCKAIHTELSQYEELVHLLSDEQLRQIVVAQTQVTGTVLIGKIKKASDASITKQAKGISADDL